jgi:hypothetical protein
LGGLISSYYCTSMLVQYMRTSIDPRVDAHSQIPIPWPGAEPCPDLIERAGLPRVPALPRELDGVGITPNAVGRAVEDLKRSGYRPLHTPRAAAELSSIPRAGVAPGRDV